MMSVNIAGRVIAVSPKEYDRIISKRRELADHDRQVSRELRAERLVPSEHSNATYKVTGSNWSPNDPTSVSEHGAWLALKNERLHEAFETMKTQPEASRSLLRMHQKFNQLA